MPLRNHRWYVGAGPSSLRFMTFRFATFVCFVTCLGCGPAVEEDSTTEAMGSTGTGDPDTTSADSTSFPGSTGVDATTSTTTAVPNPTTSGAESSTSVAAESSSGEPIDADCESLCGSLLEGSCLDPVETCLLACEDAVGTQGEAVAAAFEACISTQPLCFSFLEDCMWAELFGEEAVEQHYTLSGTGFDAWEGRAVHSRLFVGDGTIPGSSGTVEDGAFTVEASITTVFDPFSNPRTFYFYVDANDDGACTAADYVQGAWMQDLGTDFSEPAFVLDTTPEQSSNEGLCPQF